jgi:sialate O-acetylesterase
MVLQRNAQTKIWGWAAADEEVSIRFRDTVYHTTANGNGEWVITVTGLKAGGPFTMEIHASNHIKINDVVVGDVWVCSGQSNMELPMSRVSPIYAAEIAESENSNIRQFAVPQRYDFNTSQRDLVSGTWKKANPENVLSFSAVAYFFARELYAKYKVPIGLINASLGGAPAEAFMSQEALRAFPRHYAEAQRFKDSTEIIQVETQDKIRIDAWYKKLQESDAGHQDSAKSWYSPEIDTAGWSPISVPGYWADQGVGAINGVVWYRKIIDVPESMAAKPAKLILGRIVDADAVFVNGVLVGTTGYQYPPRRYEIRPGILREGKNVLVVRVISTIGIGGFVPDKPYQLVSDDQTMDLKGTWLCRLGARMEPLTGQTFIRWKPLGLYNAMISPLLHYSIKGVIWYQGESNVNRSLEYRELFSALINNWRHDWKQGEFPFLFVQLPNFMEVKAEPSESEWASMREAQSQALSLHNTGMAVTIDIGEWNDIHPLNKKDVGKRLALVAQKVAYGDRKVVHSGPMYRSAKFIGNRAVITFTNVGSGLRAKGGDLRGVAVAGSDKRFVWAKAKIQNNKVVVWSEKVPHPTAVRYAWADNPEGANLYNKEGLPASPFRTEE